ncbi:MAG: GerMN domain-containing protein [Candidatus Hydrogenedentes bacterium]|nr:GerMN domain-containing protein [Candidatus Hydrogenedentota bacterium]MBI3118981.1 GerMN domain-containing protein [Candidatus Hydrogenedentota bacterium]
MKKAGLAVWGMFTMVLLFCVILLVREMTAQGQDPLASLRAEMPPAGQPAGRAPEKSTGVREVILYFASQDGRVLAPEIRSIEYTDSTLENCRHALEQLIEGPRDILTPVLPPNTQINAMYLLDDGELVVDFSRELQTEQGRFRSTGTEALLAYAVANTLTQKGLQGGGEAAPTRVRILLEGSRPQETFPAHLDLSGPLWPDPNWIERVEESTPAAAS